MTIKRLRIVLAGTAVLFTVLAAMVWWLPASWGLRFLQPRLHGLRLQQVTGTVWQGQAGQVLASDGSSLGAVEWSLSRRALLGDIDVDLNLQQPQLSFQGHMHQLSNTQEEWRDVTLSLDPSMLNVQPWLHAKPAGQLQLTVARAQLQGGWPMHVNAAAHWIHAAVHTELGVATLGGMAAQVSGDNGVLQANLRDDGDGALHMSGLLSLSPLGWNLQMSLKPRKDDPALDQWLHTLGNPEADGTVRLGYRGGLADMNSTPGTQ
jgi:general secretion pathway protein N